jgi:hypothetical protein
MKKGRFIEKSPWMKVFEEVLSGKTFEEIQKELESRDEEDYDDIQYIDLVYPPGSNPPIRNSIKKMTLIGLNHITLKY